MEVGTETNSKMIKEIVALKKENEKMEELINFYKAENFDYALKCNRMENVLGNIHSVTKNSPGMLLETFDNICNILEVGGIEKKKPEKNQSQRILQKSEKTTTGNKAHIVKPHMVNGHILYVPTINLTRVSNLNTQTDQSDENNAMTKFSNEETENAGHLSPHQLNQENGNEVDNTVESIEEYGNEDQLSPIKELSEPSTSSSKSTSHSTVLSGTFQEVKIYLNQTSSDSLQEESKNLKKKSLKKLSSEKIRGSTDRITKRKRT